jgi:hypothetical protein
MKYLVVLMMAAASLWASDATGTWNGTLTRDGREPGPALLMLKQDGAKVTGTAGPGSDEQHEIQNGKVEDGKITFEIAQDNGSMKFVLRQEGDEIKGDVSRERDGQHETAKLAVKKKN